MAVGVEGSLAAGYGMNFVNMMFGGMTNTQNYAYNNELMKEQNAYNTREANRQREFSHNEALLQREYEERMANSAYQRARADMEAAGFNPAMLAGSSSAAATPQGATAQGVAAHGNTPSFSGALNSGAAAQLFAAAAKDKELAFQMAKVERQAIVEDAKANYYNSAAAYQNALADDIKDVKNQNDLKDFFDTYKLKKL